MQTVVIGVDVGTSSTKALAVSSDGEILGNASVSHPTFNPRPGWYEHDAEAAWWGGLVATVAEVVASLRQEHTVAALGLSGCGPCVVPVDTEGTALRNGILYGVDTRASAQVQRLQERFTRAEALSSFGQLFSSQVAGAKVDWLIENEPSTYAATRWLLTVNGFLALRLTGNAVVDHHQAAYFAPYYRAGSWDTVDAADRSIESRLPTLLWSNGIAGQVTTHAATATGLPVGIPVVIGSSDGLTGAVGAGAAVAGDTVINYGSTIGITTLAPTGAVASEGIWRTPGRTPDADCLVAALSSGGSILRWFADTFADDLSGSSSDDYGTALERLTEDAEKSPPGAAGLLALPYFQGERSPFYDPDIRGALLGLTLAHGRGDMYRAMVEGLAYAVRDALQHLRGAGAEIGGLRAVGGGTASGLLLQTVSDVADIEQTVVTPHHGAPVGAAVLAAEAAGLLPSTSGSAWITQGSSVVPDPAVRDVYDKGFVRFKSAVHAVQSLSSAQSRPDSE